MTKKTRQSRSQLSRNPYHVEGQEPTLQHSVLAFMDILGYLDMIRRSQEAGTEQQLLRKLHGALIGGRAWLEEKELPAGFGNLTDKDDYALKAFTDNIVIGWPVKYTDAESELISAFSKLAVFQFLMVTEGFFIRGAISIGDAFVDEITVFGNALSEAYLGESSLARDPRIILTPSAVETAKRHLGYYRNPWHAPHVREVLKDSDGQWFLNYLDYVLVAEEEQGPFYDEFLKHKEAVEQKLQEYQEDPPIWSKYAWVAGYHNYFCDLHSDHFVEKHKINVELFRMSPALIVDQES